MDLQLAGKTALVTGSSKGIGEAIARALAKEAATVVVHGRDRDQAERVALEINAAGGRAYMVVGDLTHDDEVQRLVQEAQDLAGHIQILVNNAGGSGGAKEDWASTQPASWASAYDRNVLAALRITTRLLPAMRRAGWGRVINISSMAALMPPPSGPDYAASKAAMNAMTVSMAKAVAADGVTVNAVSPGTIHSDALDQRFREVAKERGLAGEGASWQEIERAVLPLFAQVPVGRVGGLKEIADAVAFLAGNGASYITGINLRVDGGMLPGL
ncbi:SDR family NAD(P)-dependent oxidoreductase [Xanthomonas sp. AM6]|uniref:SDR family NAD(P)-dependent oxidoreductase n=1 Tax=Xanthomonas sp. AM6 TaxID=2982531 RepID=UPI0021D9D013|nr:SDR family NAD(P)-dependent oxidoreductase [Xanthomonas sp. AM6]UYB51349.1 SDR family NAD(P)-dependent oxidoreductase [Xanthomonas sp. AM6]